MWRPMVAPAGRYAGNPSPDPERRARPLTTAIVTNKPTLQSVTESDGTGAVVGSGRLVVDVERAEFPQGALPRRGDRFELQDDPSIGTVEVVRVADDGSARVPIYCAIVREPG